MAKKLKFEKQKKREKWNIFNTSSQLFDKDLISGAHIELFSNNQIVVDGCLGVFEYNDIYLKIKLSSGALIINGSGFDIVAFENKMITVKGKINSVEFCV